MTTRKENLPGIQIKSLDEITKMREAGRLAAEVLEMIEPYVKPGISTLELNDICHNFIVQEQKAIPACLNYHGFPKSICTSVNRVVCHGIPDDKKLKSGDIINIDVTVIKDGYHGDTGKMFLVGDCSILAKRLCRVAQECLYQAIQLVKPGTRLGDIGATIQQHAESHHYSVVREYCGHGIGREFHEQGFQVVHYGKPNTGLKLEPGMTFTIEPMINAGKADTYTLSGKQALQKYPEYSQNTIWPAYTSDRSLSAQWEHTLLVTETGVEVLTLRKEESIFP